MSIALSKPWLRISRHAFSVVSDLSFLNTNFYTLKNADQISNSANLLYPNDHEKCNMVQTAWITYADYCTKLDDGSYYSKQMSDSVVIYAVASLVSQQARQVTVL
jgi:hypothetical protein